MDISELKKAAQAATPGPWTAHEATEALHAVRTENGRIIADVGYSGSLDRDKDNAAYIAAANPAVVLALIGSHEQLVAALKTAKTRLQFADKHIDCSDEIAAIDAALAVAGAA